MRRGHGEHQVRIGHHLLVDLPRAEGVQRILAEAPLPQLTAGLLVEPAPDLGLHTGAADLEASGLPVEALPQQPAAEQLGNRRPAPVAGAHEQDAEPRRRAGPSPDHRLRPAREIRVVLHRSPQDVESGGPR